MYISLRQLNTSNVFLTTAFCKLKQFVIVGLIRQVLYPEKNGLTTKRPFLFFTLRIAT